jgi:hypothetical protein
MIHPSEFFERGLLWLRPVEEFIFHQPLGGEPVIEITAGLFPALLIEIVGFSRDTGIKFIVTDGERW